MIITEIFHRYERPIACLLILLALGLSSTYLIHPIEHFDADEAIVGLMGRHILNGHIPAYFYGQGYMGSLEALIAAGYFAIFGSSVFILKIAPLTFYILFLILQYRLIRKFGGVGIALMTLAITVVFSNTMILWSTKARGGFTETLFWGTLAYSLFFRLMDGYFRGEGNGGWRIFLLGSVIGIGFWNSSMVAYYYLPIALYLIIFGTAEMINIRRDRASTSPDQHRKMARWRRALRLGGRYIIPVIVIYIIFSLITIIQGEIDFSLFGLKIRSHNGVRDIIRGLSILTVITTVLVWERSGLKHALTLLRKFSIRYPIIITAAMIVIIFLLITAGINLYFRQLPDYFYGHYQPLGPAEDFHKIEDNISQLFTLLLPKVIGVSYSSFKLDLGPTRLIRYSGISNRWTLAIASIFVIIFLLTKLARQRSIQEFIRNHRLSIFFLTSLIGCFSAISLSSLIQDSTAYRYLIPVISWLPFFLASFSLFLWKKSKWAGILMAIIIIGGHSTRLITNLPIPKFTTPEPLVSNIIESLTEEKITRAFVDYWIAYPITFITREEIISAPYRSHDRYPPYTRIVHDSPTFAYIFRGYKQQIGKQQQDSLSSNHIAYQKKYYRWGYLLLIGGNQIPADK